MKKKSSGNWWYKFLFAGMVLSAFALVGSNIYMMVTDNGSICDSAKNLISNIISVWGIAVATWVGASIADRLDRQSVMDLNDRVEEINRYLGSSEREAFRALLRDLESNRDNAITYWFSDTLSGIDEHSFSGSLWIAMKEEEELYRQLQQSKAEKNYNDLLKQIEIVRRLLKEFSRESNGVVETILSLREIEAHFLIAYSLKNNDGIEKFIAAIEYYQKHTERFHFDAFVLERDISKIAEKTEKGYIKGKMLVSEKLNWPVWAYISNLIGESYSKIIDYNNPLKPKDSLLPGGFSLEECGQLAIGYCTQATIIASVAECQRETYYRNLGCAIERKNYGKLTPEVLDSAMEQYRKALQCGGNRQKAFSCLTSAYNKKFEALKKEEKTPSEKFWAEYEQIQQLYVLCYSEVLDSHIRAAIFYRNRYLTFDLIKDAESLAREAYIISCLSPKGKEHDIFKKAEELCRKVGVSIPPSDTTPCSRGNRQVNITLMCPFDEKLKRKHKWGK